MHKRKFIVSSFYKFVYLRNPDVIKKKLFINLKKFNIKGTFILGKEGINASFSVSAEQFGKVKNSIRNLMSTEIKLFDQSSLPTAILVRHPFFQQQPHHF